MNDSHFCNQILPAAKGGMGLFSAHHLALRAFLASAEGAKNSSGENFDLKHEDVTYKGAIKLWFDAAKRELAPKN